MKTYIKLFFGLLFSLGLTSCETVVDIDLPTAEPRLVIEANLDFNIRAFNGEQMIRLSLTTDYYSKEIPKVHQAIVTVESSNGKVFIFTEKGQTGEYYCDYFAANLEDTYKLQIVYENEVYEATENLIEVPEIIEVEQTITKIFSEELYQITSYFQDNPDEDNYYLVRYELEGEKNSYSVFSDKFSQGKKMETSYFSDEIKIGDELNIRLYGISKSYYNYMNTLLGIIEGGGGPFEVPTGQVRGNVQNITDQKNYPLGYFRLTQYDTKKHIIN
ncbi:DUF4249 domain-containing protein [Flavobacterium sp. NKUCC04_CG]|uniref:DUF4249 domain-containing protein n=1 Tax=Flavobacterium sp. NKUCC04_CG TaxID=2842121 RepID=UPI001C5AD815|nr:DUF4249 domain-containing protein [Flavobacterium sp. NKUCC04_CG]MBW3519319.1 DUF4249 domain-containing protein [Flavobacterium sp. NKUCC04_CG]